MKDAAHVMQGKKFLRRELGKIAPVESVFGAPDVRNDQHPELVVKPLRRRVRKLFDRHRQINRGVALVNVGKSVLNFWMEPE